MVIACDGLVSGTQHIPYYRTAYRGIYAYSSFFAVDEPGNELAVVQASASYKVVSGEEGERVVAFDIVHSLEYMGGYEEIVFEGGCRFAGKFLHCL